MKPTLRKPAGVLGIIAGLVMYAALVGSLAGLIGRLPILVQAPIYLVLGDGKPRDDPRRQMHHDGGRPHRD